MRSKLKFLAALAVGLVLASCARPAAAHDQSVDHEHDMDHRQEGANLELFLSLQGLSSDGPSGKPERQEDSWGAADLVFSANHGRWRAMGEYNLGPIEHDLERFQVGFEPVPDTLLWLGRFHQPGSAWNDEFHHGHYLQTAITRPSIEFWEDEEGLLPQHLAGALLESRQPVGAAAGVQLSLGLGLGSVLDNDGLEPVAFINRNRGGHQLSETARISFLPQYLGSSSVGLLFGHHRLPVVEPVAALSLGAQWVDQNVTGAYVDLDRDVWRAVGVVYFVDVDLQGGGADRREHFASGYLQLERQVGHGLTVFGRHENSADASHSRFVAIHADDFVAHGNLVGLRWDFARRQALTIQLARETTLQHTQSVGRIQWSGVVP